MDWPRARAISPTLSTASSTRGSIWLARNVPLGLSPREPSVLPVLYLPDNTPWASGENAITPIPSSPQASIVLSFSIQRLIIE
ncbi:hypothetical protein D3C87_1833530 [compost metagenome]